MGLQIVQILASGTFGHVCVVRDAVTDRLFAAKVLRPSHIHNPKIERRIRDEAAMLSRLDHPHIVGIHEIREIEGQPVLLLEWVRGAPLDAVVNQAPDRHLPAPDVIEILRTTVEALQVAYATIDPQTGKAMAVIHRDVKPSNLLMAVDGTVKLVDFGIAKGDFAGKESETVSVVLGADGYVAPERFDGAPDSPAGDIFALGCVAYELLSGDRIGVSLYRKGYEASVQRHLMRLRPPGFDLRATRTLVDLIEGMTAYDPAMRPDYATVSGATLELLRNIPFGPALEQLAQELVVPLLAQQAEQRADQHPAYEQLRFLESDPVPDDAPEPNGDRRLRAFLAQPHWQARSETLQQILLEDPAWTAAPWAEVLDSLKDTRILSWIRGPSHEGTDRDRVVLALQMMARRPDPNLAPRLRWLRRHQDPEIRDLALQLLNGDG
ncbi:MAG: serine/threonine-protein kinase [Myxococcota bacterium]